MTVLKFILIAQLMCQVAIIILILLLIRNQILLYLFMMIRNYIFSKLNLHIIIIYIYLSAIISVM